jgi:ATP-dependent DNA helicase RecG
MEHQNIEYKESWRDEYIKWICGFCNATGGKIYIGIDDDKGNVKGIADAKKLIEEIPNKTKDILGIIVDVNIKTKSKLQYLEIIVEAYPYPISYKGQYHYRSGSTKQELKGAALDKFILQKQGKKWDGVPQLKTSVKNLSIHAFADFKRMAGETKRVDAAMLKDKPNVLLDKLHLKTEEGYLKKAAILLFHPNPEKYITGAYIKIGFFNTDDDLAYQDEVHGHLFTQVEKIMDLLLTKYLKANISYNKLQRIEQYPIPESALREAILNAIIHKDYTSGNPVQISVYTNKIIIWNAGELPDKWTVEHLKKKHPSIPFNPDVANAFFRAGMIEAWGRGTVKIINDCKKAKTPTPSYKYDMSGFIMEFEYVPANTTINKISKSSAMSEKIIAHISQNENITIPELSRQLTVSLATIKRTLIILQTENKIERIGSNKKGAWRVMNP